MKYENRERKNQSIHKDFMKQTLAILGLGKNLTGAEQFKDLNIKIKKNKTRKK